jgi:hypothetical protein
VVPGSSGVAVDSEHGQHRPVIVDPVRCCRPGIEEALPGFDGLREHIFPQVRMVCHDDALEVEPGVPPSTDWSRQNAAGIKPGDLVTVTVTDSELGGARFDLGLRELPGERLDLALFRRELDLSQGTNGS